MRPTEPDGGGRPGGPAAHPAVPLARLLEGLPHRVEWAAGPEARDGLVSSITADSRAVVPGACFVAVRGTRIDGHAFVEEALAKGAAAVVVDRPEVARRLAGARRQAAVAVVPDSRVALAWLAAAWHGHPSRALHLVGITGTVGKTSTALYLRQLLEASGRRTGAVGSLGIFLRDGWRPSELTTPDPLSLQGALREMVDQGLRVATLEVSSHALIQHRAAFVRLSTGVITDIVPHEHADIHPTFEAYLEAKARFFQLLDPEATLVYSAASPHTSRLAARWPASRRVRFEVAGGGAADRSGAGPLRAARGGRGERGRVLSMDMEGTRLELAAALDGELDLQVAVRLPLLGTHAALAAAGAAAAALTLGVQPEALRHGLEALRPLRRRMEVLLRRPFAVVDDTTGHPASFDRLFDTLAACGARGIVLLVGVRGSRGEEINARNGRAVAAWSHRLPFEAVVVTDAQEAAGPRDRVRAEERQALLQALEGARAPVRHVPTLEQAVAACLERVRPGGVLVMAGAQGLDGAAGVLRQMLRLDGGPASPGP